MSSLSKYFVRSYDIMVLYLLCFFANSPHAAATPLPVMYACCSFGYFGAIAIFTRVAHIDKYTLHARVGIPSGLSFPFVFGMYFLFKSIFPCESSAKESVDASACSTSS